MTMTPPTHTRVFQAFFSPVTSLHLMTRKTSRMQRPMKAMSVALRWVMLAVDQSASSRTKTAARTFSLRFIGPIFWSSASASSFASGVCLISGG